MARVRPTTSYITISDAGQLDEVIQPRASLASIGERVELVEVRGVLVLDDQPGLVPTRALAPNQQVVVHRRPDRLRDEDAALEIVDVVIEPGSQMDHRRHEPGVLASHLDAQALGANQEILPAQEVDRTARATELLAAGHGARHRGEAVEHKPPFAQAR